MRALVGAACIMLACSEPQRGVPHVDRIEPAFGPLVGGTSVRIDGTGFTISTRVLIGGREAPLVHLRDETTLEVVIPPGDEPGDAEVVVLDSTGFSTARGMFRYSAPPTIVDVSPRDVWHASWDTRITVTGSGFLDENAGELDVLLGGMLIDDVVVTSDTSLSFIAPARGAFTRDDLEVIDVRGRAMKSRAIRYTPGQRPGLLLFPRWSSTFVVFYDPVDQTSVAIPSLWSSTNPFTTVVRDGDGEYWGVDYSNRIGRIDLAAQVFQPTGTMQERTPASTWVGDGIVAVTRSWSTGVRFGRVDPQAASFTPIGAAPIVCCGGFGLASDGTTVWMTSRHGGAELALRTIDRDSGALGTPVVLAGPVGFRVEDLRIFDGVLYAVGAGLGLATLDPMTGVLTTLPVFAHFVAMEVYE